MPSMTGSAVVSVMKLFGKKKKEYEIVLKEQQHSSETVGVKPMTLSEAEKLEGMEVSSDAILEGKQNPAEGPITQFETPHRPAPRFRRIIRPRKCSLIFISLYESVNMSVAFICMKAFGLNSVLSFKLGFELELKRPYNKTRSPLLSTLVL
ncbi:hypothetical protein WUBG_06950 [Wuchereria bancrofti]|uniref:Uncharacterized protein n=1 Tax=Wuchereria bancrofti TaxID=6293 RepID=J9B558_WUCBA|nr:hypothetical protein WUBG_06950 [Wuchereria bancrofti]VDM20315.1 unnamed protein product [Wuchereria bancrofti]